MRKQRTSQSRILNRHPVESLKHLIHLRASQINQCGFCVKMHTREAREANETNERLDRLIVWRHVSDFTSAERAALAWTDQLLSAFHRAITSGSTTTLTVMLAQEISTALKG
ncbi:carboxymuconolactone decarboxylase family protein [Pseudomonas sp. ANT_H12B]|nr:carboxymuconolactone decarboxylase family protein [Pseudomonas sp. ANT_H12B]